MKEGLRRFLESLETLSQRSSPSSNFKNRCAEEVHVPGPIAGPRQFSSHVFLIIPTEHFTTHRQEDNTKIHN